VWRRGQVLAGESEVSSERVVVEWLGTQPGHPGSYGLLGGYRIDDSEPSRIELSMAPEGRFNESLAQRADTVEFGLPDEFRDAILEFLSSARHSIVVTLAAHGLQGSSDSAYQHVADLLIANT
jgi:hypothetical protein